MARFLSIRARLTLFYTSLLFTALIVFAALATWLLHHRLTDQVNAALDHRIQGVENFLRRETRPETVNSIPDELAEFASTQPEGHLIEVRDEHGRVLLAGEPVPAPAITRVDDFVLYGRTYRVRGAASLGTVESANRELRSLFMT